MLKDSTGNTIDVLRFGNYTFSGVGADPYPNNRSIGSIVPYQSFARFGGAYKTGAYSNSAEDFYVTGVQIANTIPQFYIAIVVAQLVGLRLAQAMAPKDPR